MIEYKNLIILPVFHNKLMFTQELRKVFYQFTPDIVAVEFPNNLKEQIMTGINRLPAISALLYDDHYNKVAVLVPIDPADSLIEAIRLGLEYNCQIEFVDVFVKNYISEYIATPDEEAIESLGYEKFHKEVAGFLTAIRKEKELVTDFDRKLFYNQNSMINAEIEIDILQSEKDDPSQNSVDSFFDNPDDMNEFREFYMASSLSKLMTENPDKKIIFVCGMNHSQMVLEFIQTGNIEHSIISMEPEIDAKMFNIPKRNIHEFFVEIPNIIYRFTRNREFTKQFIDNLDIEDSEQYRERINKHIVFDRKEELKKIIFAARERYKQEYEEDISMHKMKSLFQYMRNLTIIKGRLFPSLFNVILSAKSIIGDDFAWILYEECTNYPDAKDFDDDLETLDISAKYFNGMEYFTIRKFKPNYGEMDVGLKIPIRRKPTKQELDKWKKEFNYYWGAVSYPPEDIFVENFFRYTRIRSLQAFQEFFTRTHEFKSTLMDGINFKETLRNWGVKKKIYVEEKVPLKGEVDAVIFIFYENKFGQPTKYENRWMFYGEHDEESDLMLYSTYPGEIMVGPGISKIEIGGVVSFFPRGHVGDIWTSKKILKFRQHLHSDADALLLGAIIYGQKKFIAYVGPRKPSAKLYDIAYHFKKSIIYLPISRFSSVSLTSIRNIHILKSRDLRDIAGEFIKKRRY